MIYQKEIGKALAWLFETQNKENFGWSWIRDISPNEQNTAEVVYACTLFENLLTSDQKQLINEATKKWLLMPQKHAVLTIDWAWVGMALSVYYDKYDSYQPDFDREFVKKDICTCVETILSLQNADGGWGDYKHDMSTAFRTSISVIFLEMQPHVKGDVIDKSVERAIKWLLTLQNTDGGFGCIPLSNMTKKVMSYYAGVEQSIVEKQYKSSIAVTGYVLWALASCNRFMYGREIESAANYLKNGDYSGGYEIFFEVGVRRGTLFTFRHFGAAWMGIGLLLSGKSQFTEPEIVALLKHFLSLQDPINGGFKCNDTSEVYTWSNCNSLMFFKAAIEKLENMAGLDYTDIIVDYLLKR